jgi:hypothetical protein
LLDALIAYVGAFVVKSFGGAWECRLATDGRTYEPGVRVGPKWLDVGFVVDRWINGYSKWGLVADVEGWLMLALAQR